MTAVPPTELAGTPAGRQLGWLLGCLAGRPITPAEAGERVSAGVLSGVTAEAYADALAETARELGGVTVERVGAATALDASARVISPDGRVWLVRCAVEEAPPHRIAAVQLTPARAVSDEGCGVPVPWAEIAGDTPVGSAAGEGLDARLAAEVDAAAAALRAELRLPAVLAAVVVDGGLAYWTRAGYAEVATRRRPTRRSAVRAAGVSAALTALVVNDLAAEGRFGLDDAVNDHLGGLQVQPPTGGVPVTIRHLLAHTAGLVDGARTPIGVAAGSAVPQLRELVGDRLVVDRPAGEGYRHSALGYALLGELVAAVTGEPFADAAAAALDRHGLRHTSYRLDDRVAHQPVCGYDVDFDEVLVAAGSEVVLRPAAGAATTLDDLARHVALLTEPGRRALVTPAAPTGLPGIGATLGGLLAAEVDRRTFAWVTGGWPGAVVGEWLLAEARLGVVLVGNAFSPARLGRLQGAGEELLAGLAEGLGR